MSDDTATPRRDIVSRDEGRTLLRASPLIRRGLDQLRTTPDRILYFPPDRAVGSVFVRDRPDGYRDWDTPAWERVGDARGEIRVNAGKEIYFSAKDMYNRIRLDSLSSEEQEQLREREDIELSYSDDGQPMFAPVHDHHVALDTLGISDIDYLSFNYSVSIDDDDFRAFPQMGGLTGLQLRMQDVSGDRLQSLASMHRLEELDLDLSTFTDESLASIRGLTTLRKLVLTNPDQSWGGELTDAGMIWLQDLVALRDVQLCGAQITDAGLSYLQNFTTLERIDLSETQVGDGSLWYLRRSENLRHLDLRYAPIGNAGLRHVSTFSRLETLDLSGTRVTDTGLSELRTLSLLRSLSLSGRSITDAAADNLIVLRGLRTLNLVDCYLSQNTVDAIRLALPDCEVKYTPPFRA